VERTLQGPRGRILDREGNILALDLAVKNVVADPKVINEKNQVSLVGRYLTHLLDVPPAIVFSKLQRKHRRYELIKPRARDEEIRDLERMKLTGVYFQDTKARNYPLGEMMCHIVGYANREGVGSAGVELKMNKYLRGRAGLRVGQKDGRRREIYTRRNLEIEPQRGADVYLTIDQKVQYFVEKALDAAMEEHSAKGAWAIVQRVSTGEILAMAVRPAYDLNEFGTTPLLRQRNEAVGNVYEPGSTLKGPVLAAALNEGVIRPEDIIECEKGCWYYGGKPLRDYHAYDRLSMADVLKKSSNIGTAKIALKLGNRRVHDYLRAFGLGARTGIDLPGEEAGILHDVSKWSKISITRVAMGHEISVTALQMLNAFCGIANGGFLMRPYVVQRVIGSDGVELVANEPTVVGRPIRPETARLMCELLGRVSEEGGTARRARVEGYKVAGKTGTATKPIPGGYSSTDHMASFVGFLPADRPEVGIIVVVDTPQPKHTGGVVAAPVFRDIAEQAVRYLDIPSSSSWEAMAQQR
jgi:cell division protein FtsI (penicillin-binding protein 3)